MMIFLLAAIDLLGAICAASLSLGYPLYSIQAIAALCLMIKGAVFYDDLVSWIDILIGATLFLLFWIDSPTMAVAIAIYLGFKGIMSFF